MACPACCRWSSRAHCWHHEGVTPIADPDRPQLWRGAAAHWPLVQGGAAACLQALAAADNGRLHDALLLRPEEHGRIGYDASGRGFNFLRGQRSVSQVLEALDRYAQFAEPPALALQSAPAEACVPSLRAGMVLPLLHPGIAPRLWLGNRVVTPTHFDESSNLAVVVAGRRRFTLFPPEQGAHLHLGPPDFAPTGTPIGLAPLDPPDPARFPGLQQALPTAQVFDLGPGDVLHIPPLWWHHVASLDDHNLLVNFWWHGDPTAPSEAPDSALHALQHALLAIAHQPPARKRAWAALYAHLVFGEGDPVADRERLRAGLRGGSGR